MAFHPNYELFEELGRGETTVVNRGWDSALNRPIAVKQLQEKFQKDERRKQKFIEQAQFLANLSHENVLSVYSLEPKHGWIVMELMKGSMEAKLKEGPLSADLVRSVVRQSLKALAYLHDQDRIHGKVRPSNILIDEHGRVKLSDFETGDSEGELPVPKGEEKYMAPELLKPEFGAVGRQLDLYCLGFTALELLVGDRFKALFPGFGEHTADAKMSWIRWHSSEDELKPAIELVRRLPSDLGQLLDKLLKKRVADRPASAHAALEMLSDTPDISVELAPEHSTYVASSGAKIDSLGPRQVSEQQRATKTREPSLEGRQGVKADVHSGKEGRKPDLSRRQVGRRFELSDKRVFYPVAAVVLLLAAVVGIWLQGFMDPVTKVAFELTPEGIAVFEGGAELKPMTGKGSTFQLKPGTHELTFRKGGYVERKQQVEVKPGMAAVPIRLDPELVKVRIVTPFPDTTVLLDGKKVEPIKAGGSEYLVAAGVHQLTAKKDGYVDANKTVEVSKANTTIEGIELELASRLDDRLARESETPPPKPKREEAPAKMYEVTVRIGPEEAKPITCRIDGRPSEVNDQTVVLPLPQEAGASATVLLEVEAKGFEPFRQALSRDSLLGRDHLTLTLKPAKSNKEAAMVDAQAFYEFGMRHFDQGEFEQALGPLTESITLVDDFADAWLARGRTHAKLSRFEAAISDLRKAVELDSQSAEKHLALAYALADSDDFEGAIRAYNDAISCDAGLVAAWIGRSHAHYFRRDFPAAFADAVRATELAPDSAVAFNSKGAALMEQQKYTEALDAFGQAIILDPTCHEALLNRGRLYFRLVDEVSDELKAAEIFAKSIRDLSQAIELRPDHAPAYNARGLSYASSGKAREAIADYDQAIKLDSRFAAAYYNRGLAYKAIGQYERWKADHDQALSLDSSLRK
jgi:serine/threonine protein kinase/tetratricopeptide (TPR) repeat protein